MKLGLFMSYYKDKNFIKKFYKNLKRELSATLLENEVFEASFLY